jgi:hypothetical protein
VESINIIGIGQLRRDIDGHFYHAKARAASFSSFDDMIAQKYASDADDALSDSLTGHEPVPHSPTTSAKAVSMRVFSPMTSVAQYSKRKDELSRQSSVRSLTPPPRRISNLQSLEKPSQQLNRVSPVDWAAWDSFT